MNQGIFGFPAALSNNTISTTEIDVSGTYLIAPGTKRLVIFAVGGGGGGGGGRQVASGTTGYGGGAGSGGAMILQDFNVEDLGGVNTTLSIVIGVSAGTPTSGGAGGQGGLSNNNSGTDGGAGGTTTITLTGKPGVLISGIGGNGGSGGTTTTSADATAVSSLFYGRTVSVGSGQGGHSQAGTFLSGSNLTVTSLNHGGAGGSGISTTPSNGRGGGIAITSSATSISNPNYARGIISNAGNWVNIGGSGGGVAGTSSTTQMMGKLSPGFGGAGGGSDASTVGGNGGAGYRGSGGGGGGASSNGFAAGTGGRGGNGYVCIVALA